MLRLIRDLALYAAVLAMLPAALLFILLGLLTLAMCLDVPTSEYCPVGLMVTALSFIPVIVLAAIMGVIGWLERRYG